VSEHLAEAIPELRRPFHPDLVQFKAEDWEADNSAVIAVPFIDRAAVIERLNFVVPGLWFPKYGSAGQEGLLWCHLTIDAVTRSDVGESNGESSKKALVSDALKRAAVHFGVGVSLCTVPKLRIPTEGNDLVVTANGKPRLTEAGEAHGTEHYERWLEEGGLETYGDVLIHRVEMSPNV
jgi:hypothetical protein